MRLKDIKEKNQVKEIYSVMKRRFILAAVALAAMQTAGAQVEADSIVADSLKNDSLKLDSMAVDTLFVDSVEVARKNAVAKKKEKAAENLKKLKLVLSNIVDKGAITAKARLNLTLGDHSQKVNATLRMKRDESIQLMILAPFIGTEIGRLEFTPDYMMVVDRFHAQYVQIAYDEIDFLKEAKIDFYSIQAMFWADLYSPGVKKTTASTPFGIGTANNSQIYLKPLGTGRMQFGFWANPTDGTIGQAKVSRVGTKYQVNCKYQAYRKLQSGKNFPTSVLISIIADHSRRIVLFVLVAYEEGPFNILHVVPCVIASSDVAEFACANVKISHSNKVGKEDKGVAGEARRLAAENFPAGSVASLNKERCEKSAQRPCTYHRAD